MRGDLVNPDDPAVNARSKEVTIADGRNTHGTVNQHPSSNAGAVQANSGGLSPSAAGAADKDGAGRIPFRVGMSEDRNKRWRRTMEDSHAFVYNFGGVQGQGFFSVFDGHAGKHSAEWCGKHFHEHFLRALEEKADLSVPDVLNETFHQVDKQLSRLAQEQGSSSGCTAVTAFLRLEDENGVPMAGPKTGGILSHGKGGQAVIGGASAEGNQTQADGGITADGGSAVDGDGGNAGKGSSAVAEGAAGEDGKADKKDGHSGGILKAFSRKPKQDGEKEKEKEESSKRPELEQSKSGLVTVTGKDVRRVLYTANVGDARAVLSRGGKAIRLTYDHKGSDAQEAKRITDAGGYVMNNRVNGVLAVTRSLGDSSMKEFVVGAPYTTETTLSEEDTLLIVACDGLWDVVDDQDAVDLIKDIEDPQQASDTLLRHALQNFSTDNTSVMVVRFAVHPSAISDPHPPTAASLPDGE